jgi:hypothetical protein
MAVLAVVLVSCWPAPKRGPQTTAGKAIVLYVHIDRGIEQSFTDYQVRNRNQTGEWMEKDMEAMLKKAGYVPRLVSRRSDYKPGTDSYLLTVKIMSYNPGAKAARMYVGYGVGAASMRTHYELYGRGQKPILADDTGVGSGQDWQKVIRKIDVMTIDAVSEKLRESGP